MEEVEIQVIIPVYNGRATLGRCLESLQRQTFPQWQALVVDDASTDGSAQLIQEYAAKDPRIRYLANRVNGGPGRARNLALDQVTAAYVAFLDGDDVWEPTMLETLYGCAKKQGADVVQCQFLYDLPVGKRLYPKGAFSKEVCLRGRDLRGVYLRMMTGINMNHVCMKLIRTACIQDLRFDTSLKTAEDLEFCVHLFERVQVYCFIPQRLYHYYRGEGASLTGGGLSTKEKLAANRAVSRSLEAALPGWGMDRLPYRLLARLRPYWIVVSKVLRTVREKLVGLQGKEGDVSEST